MVKRVFSVYFSPTSTTRRTVEAIAAGTGLPAEVIDLTPPEAREKDYAFTASDLVIIGMPVYGGVIPTFLPAAIERLHGAAGPVVLVAVYGNRHYDDTLLQLRDLMSIQGFIPVAAGAFLGEHTFGRSIAAGRPDAADLEKCRAFGAEVAQMLAQTAIGGYRLEVPGNYPFKPGSDRHPMVPTGGEGCIACGRCAALCPMGAIRPATPRETDAARCINCMACVKNCPTGARAFPEAVAGVEARLAEICGPSRKEPVLFFGDGR